jgi:recombination protein RecA
VNLILYYGVLGARAAWRPEVVPRPPSGQDSATADPVHDGGFAVPDTARCRARGHRWADLMRRTFGFDVLACPRCDGRLRLVALIEEAAVIGRILQHLGLPTDLPVAQAQKLGGVAAFVDAEHALDALYSQKLGVDLENLLVSQPDNGEQALEITEMLIRPGGVDVVVVDSVAALVPRAEIEGEMGEAQMGPQAWLMSQALRKLTGVVSKSKTCLIFINQLREKIGVMFGNPETTTGGRALKFYSSVRVDIRRIGAIKDGDAVVGGRTRVKIVKNKVAPPFRQAEFDVMYGEGISREGDLVDKGVELNIVEKSGTWFSYGGDRLGQGRENAKAFLKQNPDTAAAIELKLRQALGLADAEA